MAEAEPYAPVDAPVARLGRAGLDEPLDAIGEQTRTSFRAVPELDSVGPALGPLKELPGSWHGTGFDLSARPGPTAGEIFLELNTTREFVEFVAIASPIPSNGSAGSDLQLAGVRYLQQVSDAKTGSGIAIEPGIWLTVRAASARTHGVDVARLASVAKAGGAAVNARGRSHPIVGLPNIDPANTVPFPVDAPAPPFGAPNEFPQYDLSRASRHRTDSRLLVGIDQVMVSDPNSILRRDLAGHDVIRTEVLRVATDPCGGLSNIPLSSDAEHIVSVAATVWIEHLSGPRGPFLQLQYSQTVLSRFLGHNWPHVSVATLVKVF